mgnify:CR=1 FL=1
MADSAIRVFIIDDSSIVLSILTKWLSSDPLLRIVGTAENGKAALERLTQIQVDVIVTDMDMPVMDGLELTWAGRV